MAAPSRTRAKHDAPRISFTGGSTVREISLDESQRLTVQGWQATEEGLFLRTADGPDEVRLKCVCGRCHWIIREQQTADGARLVVTCHSCGSRGSFQFQSTSHWAH